MYVNIDGMVSLEGEYYNHKALAFEPFLEPFVLLINMTKETPYTADNINIDSTSMLNLNVTDGLARTIRKIVDRINLSQEEAAKIIAEEEDEIDSMIESRMTGSTRIGQSFALRLNRSTVR